ncbi:MAG TPA: WS/DGAT domain-containing protein, partial [Acidimicrobiales bacterium]
TPFNAAITPHRKVAFTSVSLADVRAVKDAFGTTVNDVILAVCAGSVRRWLEERGALPDRSLIAGVPVSTRGDDEGANFGANLISAMFVALATDVDDPVERLLTIRESTKDAKEEFRAVGADALQNWTEFSGPRLFGLAVRLYSQMELADLHPPALNFLVSNVPGPPIPLYFAGGRLMALYPLGPVFDGMGLNITVLSYMDQVGFGLLACREVVPDLWHLTEGMNVALDELTARAKGQPDGRVGAPPPETPSRATRAGRAPARARPPRAPRATPAKSAKRGPTPSARRPRTG